MGEAKAPLLDDEGELTSKFEAALLHIFARFSSSYKTTNQTNTAQPGPKDVLTETDLDEFAIATNGEALSKESKDEIKQYLDTDSDGNLTFRGFCEMFHLQSDNDADETWKDLSQLGFDHQLEYVGRQ